MSASNADSIHWRFDIPAREWDMTLASMSGHPLQSAMWGQARRVVDRIEDHRWGAFVGREPVFMARFEVRPMRPLGRATWIPRGPAMAAGEDAERASGQFFEHLRALGYLLCVDDRYVESGPASAGVALFPRPQTAFIDLTGGREKLWNRLDHTMRYGVRTAAKGSVVVEQTRDHRDVSAFFSVCSEVGRTKGFHLQASEPLLRALLDGASSSDVETRLFVARKDSRVVAGACILRCGTSAHYFWGGVDRNYSRLRTGEAVQWKVIEWAIESGLHRYDLEGIDSVNNPGTYQFKMKMGAAAVELPGRRAYPLTVAGRVMLTVARSLGRI